MSPRPSGPFLAALALATTLGASSAAAAPVTSHPRLYLTPALAQQLRARAVASNPLYTNGVRKLAEGFKAKMVSGEIYQLDDGNPWKGVDTGYDIATGAEVLAFQSLVDPDPARRADFGKRARDLAMYVVDRVLVPEAGKWFHHPIFATDYRGNFHGEAIPLAVDWAYGYFSAADKQKVARVFMRWIGQNLTATTSGYDHPSPVGVTSDPVLFEDRQRLRTSLNNFSASHMRNITLMSLAVDPADEPLPLVYGTDNKLASMGLSGYATLRDHVKEATGAWLYTVDEALDRYAGGGVPVEGFEYNGVSTARMAETYLALFTAGYDDPALYGPHVVPANNAFWGEILPALFHLVSPRPAVIADFSWLGPLYQPANYGDIEKYYSPDFMNLFGPLGTYDLLKGNTARLAQIRWVEKNMAPGGAAGLASRASDATSPRAALFYYVLFDPAAAEPPDPRPALPTFHVATGMNSVQSRTGWGADAAWLSYMLPWNDVDHQQGTGNMIQLWRRGEWITKERSGYGYSAGLSSYKNTLAIENDPPSGTLDFVLLAQEHGAQPAYVATGDPTLIAYSDRAGFTTVTGDATNLYNAGPQYASADVLEARRTVFWQKPDTLFVFDRARTGEGGRFKRFWLNFTAQPQIVGARARVTTPGGQAVALDSLLPAGAALLVDTAKPLYDPQNASTDQTAAGETAKWRVRVDAPGDPADASFLHVLQAKDSAASLGTPALVKGDAGAAFQGARLGDTVVMFASDIRARPASAAYHVPQSIKRHFVTGLDPDRVYSASVTSANGEWGVAITASALGTFVPDAGGTLALTVQNGAATPGNDAATAWFTDEDLEAIGAPDALQAEGAGAGSTGGSGTTGGSPQGGSPPAIPSAKLASLVISGLSPAFDPAVTSYTVSVPAGTCSVPVVAALQDPALALQIQSTAVQGGKAFNAWLCDGHDHVSLVVYQGWTEVGRTTVTRVTPPSSPPVQTSSPPAQTSSPPAQTSSPPAPSGTVPSGSPLASLVIPGLSPAFSPAVASYTVPKPASGSVSVTATLGDPTLMLHIQSNPATSGQPVNAWVGSGGKISVVIYKSWTEVGRYTVISQ